MIILWYDLELKYERNVEVWKQTYELLILVTLLRIYLVKAQYLDKILQRKLCLAPCS